MTISSPIRIGAVSYLNTRPLVYGLQASAPNLQVIYDLPSRLADQLASGILDVALIPSVEYLRHREYRLVSNACIGCRGPVLSVKLFSRTPLSQIRTLALDEGSRTSIAMTQILLQQVHGVRPQLESLPIGEGLADVTADAALLIGDRAIGTDSSAMPHIWDLGQVWQQWSGLPFVFAVWAAGPDSIVADPLSEQSHALSFHLAEARERGLANLEEIAAIEARNVGLSHTACLAYLRDNLYFYLEEQQVRSLRLFYKHAVGLGLAQPGRHIENHDLNTIG